MSHVGDENDRRLTRFLDRIEQEQAEGITNRSVHKLITEHIASDATVQGDILGQLQTIALERARAQGFKEGTGSHKVKTSWPPILTSKNARIVGQVLGGVALVVAGYLARHAEGDTKVVSAATASPPPAATVAVTYAPAATASTVPVAVYPATALPPTKPAR
jgi:hypothetical protein